MIGPGTGCGVSLLRTLLAALTQLPLTKLWPIVAANMCCIITGCVAATTEARQHQQQHKRECDVRLAASTNLITAYRLDFDAATASAPAAAALRS